MRDVVEMDEKIAISLLEVGITNNSQDDLLKSVQGLTGLDDSI
jgi:hypothetical protein